VVVFLFLRSANLGIEKYATFTTNATYYKQMSWMLFSQQHLATFRNKTPALQQMGIFCNIVLGLL
jgi:hypothetical protein